MKRTITKWLVSLDVMDNVVIVKKEVNPHAPINRILDDVGFYHLDAMVIKDITYLIVIKPEEIYTKKSIILVSRIETKADEEHIVDMSNEDQVNIEEIVNKFLRDNKRVIQ